jgi:hypothetical protein
VAARRRVAAVLLAALGVTAGLGACGDDEDDARSSGSTSSTTVAAGAPSTGTDVPYVLADVDGWQATERADPDPADARSLPGDPSVDWYASFERSVVDGDVTHVSSVRVSGHALPLDATAEQLLGRTFEPVSIGGFEALVGEPPAATEPAIVLLSLEGTSTVMALSYELALDSLVGWAEHLRLVSDEEWAAIPSRG